eukprot:4762758-Amphidinium_carterae.1
MKPSTCGLPDMTVKIVCFERTYSYRAYAPFQQPMLPSQNRDALRDMALGGQLVVSLARPMPLSNGDACKPHFTLQWRTRMEKKMTYGDPKLATPSPKSQMSAIECATQNPVTC